VQIQPEFLLTTKRGVVVVIFQDHAFAGISTSQGMGTVTVLCMSPLDLLKLRFQASTCGLRGQYGVRHLVRLARLGPKIASNASS
jgi:hypothetical protein